MYPPHADDPPGRYPAALLNDPETAEEVREALAIARAEARALHDEARRLAHENAHLTARLERLEAGVKPQITALGATLADVERLLTGRVSGRNPLPVPLREALERITTIYQAIHRLLSDDGRRP